MTSIDDTFPAELGPVTREALDLLVRCLETLQIALDADGQDAQFEYLVQQAVEFSRPENQAYRIVRVENK